LKPSLAISRRSSLGLRWNPTLRCFGRPPDLALPWSHSLSGDQADRLLSGSPDYVLDCIDDVNTKGELLAYCVTHGIRVLTSMGAGEKEKEGIPSCFSHPSQEERAIQLKFVSALYLTASMTLWLRRSSGS
jgi:hypothetical protein